MPEVPPSLAEFAARELRGRGLEIRTLTTLDAMDERSATLSTGERIPARTVPGVARKVRLAVDWTTGLFCGRATAEPGQLGHPPALADQREATVAEP
jgi:NADH dehydrogenase FAD-containing subunit